MGALPPSPLEPPGLRTAPIWTPSPTRPVIVISTAYSQVGVSQPSSPGTASFTAHGYLNSEDCQWTISCPMDAHQCTLVPDFSGVNATSYRAVLYRNGVQLADVASPPGGLSLMDSFQGTTPVSVAAVIPTGGGPALMRIICITSPCPGWPVTMGGQLYLADRIDLIPINPSPGTSIKIPQELTSLDLSLNEIGQFVVNGSSLRRGGTQVDAPEPAIALEFTRPQLSPNPALGPVQVSFALPQAARARVAVLDVAGRTVRALADASYPAGIHRLTWDGRTEKGAKAPAGIYFLRVESGDQVRVSRMTRLW
jgi:hypothetical protein